VHREDERSEELRKRGAENPADLIGRPQFILTDKRLKSGRRGRSGWVKCEILAPEQMFFRFAPDNGHAVAAPQ